MPPMKNAKTAVMQRRDDPAGTLVEGEPLRDRSARTPRGPARVRELRRRGASLRLKPPRAARRPIIAIPISSSLTSGGNSADDAALVEDEDPVGERQRSPRARATRAAPPSRRPAARRGGGARTRSRRRRARASAAPRSVRCGSRDTSRAITTFCWLPPESEPPRVAGPPPRTSNSLRSPRAQLDPAAGFSQPKRENGCLP